MISNRARELSCCLAPNDLGQVAHAVSYHSALTTSRASRARAGVPAPTNDDGKVTRDPSVLLLVFTPFNAAVRIQKHAGQFEVGGGGWGHNACGYYSGLDLLT